MRICEPFNNAFLLFSSMLFKFLSPILKAHVNNPAF